MSAYAAFIVRADTGYGDAEIVIMANPDDNGVNQDLVAAYPLPADADPDVILTGEGWRVVPGTETLVDHGSVLEVAPYDYLAIVTYVTLARRQAKLEHERQDTAYRTMIRDAMLSGESATRIAEAAQVVPARVYQIKEGRR